MHRPRLLTGTVLNPLILSPAVIPEHSVAGTVVGALSNLTAGSTLSLTVDAGTRFAISGTNIVAGATQTDFATATSHSITVRETKAGALNTPNDTVITVTVQNVTGGLATPSLSNFSALGASPLVLQGSTADFVAGYRGQLQIATDSGFTSITQNQIFFIDGNSWASNSVATGITTPAGVYFARWRVVRDNEFGLTTVTGNDLLTNALSFTADVSLWSNTFTDNITSSTAVWTSVNGNQKSSFLTINSPFLAMQGTLGVGAFQGVAATIAGVAKSQFEITITTLATDSNRTIAFGLYNGTTNVGGGSEPGVSDSNGYAIQVTPGSTNLSVFKSSAGSQIANVTMGSAVALGDVFSVETDTSVAAGSHTITIYRNNVLVSTITGQTLTGFTTAWASVKSNEKLTANFGASAFTHTLDAGYAIYG